LLAQEGSVSPCYDLLRTIYETITRAYLFALDNQPAELMLKQKEKLHEEIEKTTPDKVQEMLRLLSVGNTESKG
jgi:hypothetical protein